MGLSKNNRQREVHSRFADPVNYQFSLPAAPYTAILSFTVKNKSAVDIAWLLCLRRVISQSAEF